MKHKLSIIICSALVLALTACGNLNEEIKKNARQNVMDNVDNPETVSIMAVSEPDSVFGLEYISPKERMVIINVMNKVTEAIMKKTENMTKVESIDYYVMDLAQRQLAVGPQLAQIIESKTPKGEFSGWKVRIDFSAKGDHDLTYRGERWVYLSKDGKTVLNSFELPLP